MDFWEAVYARLADAIDLWHGNAPQDHATPFWTGYVEMTDAADKGIHEVASLILDAYHYGDGTELAALADEVAAVHALLNGWAVHEGSAWVGSSTGLSRESAQFLLDEGDPRSLRYHVIYTCTFVSQAVCDG